MAKQAVLVKEVPSGEGRLPVLAIARPDGICYSYNPNQFHFELIWKGHLGWQQDDGKFTLNQATAESFHIRENPWKIDVGKGQFDFDWLGYEVGESGVVMRYTLTEKRKGNTA